MERAKCDGMKVDPTIANSIPLVTITVLLQHISSHFPVPTRTLMVHLHFIVRGRTLARVFSVRYSTLLILISLTFASIAQLSKITIQGRIQ